MPDLGGIILIDNGGDAIFSYPYSKDQALIAGILSAAAGIAKALGEEEVSFMKLKDGVIAFTNIGKAGKLLFILEGVDDFSSADWIIRLFNNELETFVVSDIEEIDEGLASVIKTIFIKFKKKFAEINKKIEKLEKLVHTSLRILGEGETVRELEACSKKIIKLRNGALYFDPVLIKKNHMDVDNMDELLDRCIRFFEDLLSRVL